jgi:hypothetical protein
MRQYTVKYFKKETHLNPTLCLIERFNDIEKALFLNINLSNKAKVFFGLSKFYRKGQLEYTLTRFSTVNIPIRMYIHV